MLNIYNQKNGNTSGNGVPAPEVASKLPKPSFKRYTDPTSEFSTEEFKWGFWFARNRVLLYRIAVGALIGLNAIFWSYTLIKGGNLILYELEHGKQLDRDLAYFYDYTLIHPKYSASPLLIAGTQILPGGVKKYDLVGEVANPNNRFHVFFDYYFVVDGAPTPVQHTFLLPGETRMISYLGFDQSDYPGGAELVITNWQWRRISNHKIIDVAAWQAERLNFKTGGFSFLRTGGTESAAANVIKFNLINASSYSFAETNFEVGLYQGETLVGILPLNLPRFKSGETRAIDLRSFVMSLNVTDIKVFPLIDIYDNSVYLPPES